MILRREQKDRPRQSDAAFPEKSPEEIEAILKGVWDNLGRLGAEFAHIDSYLGTRSRASRKQPDRNRGAYPRTVCAATARRQAGADLCEPSRNWELPAWRRSPTAGRRYALPAAEHFLRQRIIEENACGQMGTLIPTGRDAPLRLADALQKGQHVAMLVDQYFTNGVDVTFFGRKTKANPTLARLLRQIECPIHGVRIIRLPGHRFRAELSEEVNPVRDAEGRSMFRERCRRLPR